MSRKAWIAVGVALGGLVLYEMFKSGPSLLHPTQVSTAAQNINALGTVISGLVTPIVTAISNTPTPAGPSSGGSTVSAPTLPTGFDTNNYSTADNFMYTDTSGSFVAG